MDIETSCPFYLDSLYFLKVSWSWFLSSESAKVYLYSSMCVAFFFFKISLCLYLFIKPTFRIWLSRMFILKLFDTKVCLSRTSFHCLLRMKYPLHYVCVLYINLDYLLKVTPYSPIGWPNDFTALLIFSLYNYWWLFTFVELVYLKTKIEPPLTSKPTSNYPLSKKIIS